MFDFDALLTTLTIVGAMGLWILFVRFVGGTEPLDVDAIIPKPWELAWPRGVQEEEPVPYRLDRLDRRPVPLATDSPDPVDACPCEEAAAA